VFGDAADNEYVYRTAVQPIISDVLSGYSGIVPLIKPVSSPTVKPSRGRPI